MFGVLLFSALVAAAPASQKCPNNPSIPLHFKYGNYPRITSDVKWGTPAQKPVETIVDTGSAGYWVYGPGSIVNDGAEGLFEMGPCNISVTRYYDWKTSKTATGRNSTLIQYSYGSNSKIIEGNMTINDTMSFPNTNWAPLPNQMVGIANFTYVREEDPGCTNNQSDFDHSILGLAPAKPSYIGIYPSFRNDLATQLPNLSPSFSMWFDKGPASARGIFNGTLLFGALPPKSKYSGKLTSVKLNPPQDGYVGYFVQVPSVEVSSKKAPTTYRKPVVSDKTATSCLLDSGTGTDNLPISQDSFQKLAGLINYQGFLAYNGSCDSMPRDWSIKYSFTSADGKTQVPVEMPLRNYARGELDFLGAETKNVCGLSLTLDSGSDCVLGAPFFSAAMLVFNDSPTQVAIAQGGVSTGQAEGSAGLKDMQVIRKGSKIPTA